jgi:hypothetical protein
MAAIVSALVAVAPSSAAGPEKTYEVGFEANCVFAPGVLTQKGVVKFHVSAEGPSSVSAREEFTLRNQMISFVLPKEWGESLLTIGVRTIKGRLVHFPLGLQGATSSQVDDSGAPAFSSGAPFKGRVENGGLEFAVPSEGTLVSPPITSGGREVTVIIQGPEGSILIELIGYNENGEEAFGPVQISCTPPANVVLASVPEGPPPPRPCSSAGEFEYIESLEPTGGPTTGGTNVTIRGRDFTEVSEVTFGEAKSPHFEFAGPNIVAVSPPGTGTVQVEVHDRCPIELNLANSSFTYTNNERAEYKNWILSGSLTPKKLGQAVKLPAGSTFNGTSEVNGETGKGTLTGSISIPPFTASLKLLGMVPASLGLTLTQHGPFEGSIEKGETGEALAIPAKLGLGITSFGLFGLTVPTKCETVEPLSLALATSLTHEQLFKTGWQFMGTTTLPHVKCEGQFGPIVGALLSLLLAGPENQYALSFAPPA